jgi:hypothetical protein
MTKICWECKQEKPIEDLKVTGSAHINRGSKPHEWVQILTCSGCQTEQIRLRDLGAVEYGESVRAARVNEFGMHLRDFAMHTIGPDVVRLSAIERGRVEATEEEKTAIADAISCLRMAKEAIKL